MRIYRPTYRKCVGGKWVTKTTAKWYAKVKVGGKRKAIPLTTDKRASEIMLADLLRREAMGQVGAVDPFAAAARVPLSQHLADWQAALRYEDASEKHIVASGKFAIQDMGGVEVVLIDLDSAVCVREKYFPAGVVMAIDPRAVVTDEAGTVVYRGPAEIPES